MLRSRAARVLLALVVAALLVVPVAAARAQRSAKTTVTVTMTEFHYRLSRASVPHGTVVFKVVNAGKLMHDFKINGKKTAVLTPGKRATLTVVFAKKGRYPYLCTVDSHAKFGMKGVLRVT